MAISVCEVSITQSPLDLPACENNAAAGAIVDFWGVVRGLEDGKEITGIDYEAHAPMAEHQMRILAETAIGKFGLTKIIIRHRIGFVPATEASIVVRVESPRRSAGTACTATPSRGCTPCRAASTTRRRARTSRRRGIAPRRSALADAKRVARHTTLSWVEMRVLTLSGAGWSVDTEAGRRRPLRHGDPT